MSNENSCYQILEEIKSEYKLMFAYDSDLKAVFPSAQFTIKADDYTTFIQKLCISLDLNCIKSDDRAFLIRQVKYGYEKNISFFIRVLQQTNKKPVSDALIYLDTLEVFSFSDTFGESVITIPTELAHRKLTIRSLDCVPLIITLNPSQHIYEIHLQSDPVQIPSVKISSVKSKMTIPYRTIATKTTLPGIEAFSLSSVFGRDVMRSAQLLSGVNAINDASANLQIRGGATEATLLVLDGMPIYKADHFYGILSAINGFYVNDFTLYKNNIPIEYGGKTSGMLQLSSLETYPKTKAIIDLNSLYASGNIQVPFSANTGLSLAGRITYSNLANSGFNSLAKRDNIPDESTAAILQNLITVRPDFDFYDLNTKFYHNIGRHRITLDAFRSRDTFTDSRLTKFRTRLYAANEELFKQTNKWENQTAALGYQFTSDNHQINVKAYLSDYVNQYNIYSVYRQLRGNELYSDTVDIFNDNHIRDLGLNIKYKNIKNQFLIGLEGVAHDNFLFLENAARPLLELNSAGYQWSVFSEKTWTSDNAKLDLKPALRFTLLPATNQKFILPQLSFLYRLEENIQFKSSIGKQMQYIRLLEHENNLGQRQQFFAITNNSTIPVGLSWNYMTGLSIRNDFLKWDVEFYYRTLDGAITHASITPGLRNPQLTQSFADYRIYSGNARSYGADFSLIYEKSTIFSMISYSLSKSENKFEAIFKNQYFPTSEDSRHQFKWVNSYRFKNFDFSANYIGATGRPYLDLSLLPNLRDRANLNVEDFTRNLDSYHRLDLGIGYNLKIAGFKSKIGISAFNVTNHTNVKYRQFIFRIPAQNNNILNAVLGSDITQLDRTFNVSFTICIE